MQYTIPPPPMNHACFMSRETDSGQSLIRQARSIDFLLLGSSVYSANIIRFCEGQAPNYKANTESRPKREDGSAYSY